MSASEKLKALDALGTPGPWYDIQFGQVSADGKHCITRDSTDEDAQLIAGLRSALPQIVAVVEAAEAFKLDQHAALREPDTPWLRITRALAALDEALS